MAYRRGGLDREVHMLRSLNDQARRGDQPRKITVGPWRLAVDPDTGDLIAIHRPTGTRRVLAALDDPSEPEEPGGRPVAG